MSTDDLSEDEEDELLAQMDIEVALAVKMITTFTGNKIDNKTAEKMVPFSSRPNLNNFWLNQIEFKVESDIYCYG